MSAPPAPGAPFQAIQATEVIVAPEPPPVTAPPPVAPPVALPPVTEPPPAPLTLEMARRQDVHILQQFYLHQLRQEQELRLETVPIVARPAEPTEEMMLRMAVDHALLSSRARQLLRVYGEPIPHPAFAQPQPFWQDGFVPIVEARVGANVALYQQWQQQARDPYLRGLLEQAIETEQRHAVLVREPVVAAAPEPVFVPVAEPTPAEPTPAPQTVIGPDGRVYVVIIERRPAVAPPVPPAPPEVPEPERLELTAGDITRLQRFHQAQMAEVAALSEEGRHLEAEGQHAAAAQWYAMAREHWQLAERAEKYLRAADAPRPAPPAFEARKASLAELRQHQLEHHRQALQNLDRLIEQAEHPQVRQLFQTAREGTQRHIALLDCP